MSTDDIDNLEEDSVEEEVAMDRILFVIKDELPKAVVDDIYQPLSNLKHVRSLSDMVAFFLIEFNTKTDADAARGKGFEYIMNGQTFKGTFVNQGVIAAYMRKVVKPGIGVGI